MNLKKFEQHYHIILASQSPRRRELLGLLFQNMSCQSADIDESLHLTGLKHPRDICQFLANKKAETIASSLSLSLIEGEKPWCVIGSDTMVYLPSVERILEKPRDKAHAREMLFELAGQKHEVYTGVSLHFSDRQSETFFDCAYVTMHCLREEIIDAYVATGESLDKAGSYGIQGLGMSLIRGLEGDLTTVVGLPVDKLYEVIKKVVL
jgi:septum formation protein